MRPFCSMLQSYAVLCAIAAILGSIGAASVRAKSGDPQHFKTPEAAVEALYEAAQSGDPKKVLMVLGADARDLVSSGDDVQDKAARERFVDAFKEYHETNKVNENEVELIIGKDGFPFPFPILRSGAEWAFDVERARDEILNRRIGENELSTIQVLLAIVDAQREYAETDWDNDGLHVYASKFRSSPGMRDGLFWPSADGQPESPLGPLVAEAAREGYVAKADAGTSDTSVSRAYHGYRFKLVTEQGGSAPGGAYTYLVGDRLLGGFGVVAFPANYGASGIMTFKVSADGTVYESDLGPDTMSKAQAITSFDPSDSWRKTKIE
ncbi:MAG: DUF2950 domain-containing protein [Hyphomicrobiaceae bacterium]